MSRNRRREELRKRGHSNARPKWKTLYWVLSLLVAVLAVSGIGWMLIRHPGIGSGIESVSLAPVSLLSEKVSGAPWVVKQAYRFAIANPDTLSNFPCYCGCGSMGHQSNLDCFVQQFNADGSVVLDNHAFGWSICVDIARDVMRMTADGKALVEIRTFIDSHYSQFGAPTDTEPISPRAVGWARGSPAHPSASTSGAAWAQVRSGAAAPTERLKAVQGCSTEYKPAVLAGGEGDRITLELEAADVTRGRARALLREKGNPVHQAIGHFAYGRPRQMTLPRPSPTLV